MERRDDRPSRKSKPHWRLLLELRKEPTEVRSLARSAMDTHAADLNSENVIMKGSQSSLIRPKDENTCNLKIWKPKLFAAEKKLLKEFFRIDFKSTSECDKSLKGNLVGFVL